MKQQYSILIIDDSTPNVDFLFHLLGEDYQIYVAIDGASVKELVHKIHPDLILLDWILPDCSGGTLLEEIRNLNEYKDTPVIMISGIHEQHILDKIQTLDIETFIPKPFDGNKLKNIIASILKKKPQQKGFEQEGDIHSLLNISQRDLSECFFLLSETINRNKSAYQEERHSRISLMAIALAKKMQLSSEEIQKLYYGIALRDIGMLNIPDKILWKKSALNFQEWEIIQNHTHLGAAILKSQKNPLLLTASEIALGHHEHWNGNGYPHRLSGEEIPVNCRICSILDTLDALVSRRPFRTAQGYKKALDIIITERGTQFDPFIVRKLMESSNKIETILGEKHNGSSENRFLEELF